MKAENTAETRNTEEKPNVSRTRSPILITHVRRRKHEPHYVVDRIRCVFFEETTCYRAHALWTYPIMERNGTIISGLSIRFMLLSIYGFAPLNYFSWVSLATLFSLFHVLP
jgi:hypothetical protein